MSNQPDDQKDLDAQVAALIATAERYLASRAGDSATR